MRKEVIETGKTVDVAIDAACLQLGCDRDQCEWEIMDLPKKAFLGLKTVPAKVKVWIEIADEKPEKQPPISLKQMERRSEETPKAKPERPQARPDRKERPRVKEPRIQTESASFSPRLEEEPVSRELVAEERYSDKERVAAQYISGILHEFGLTAQLQLYREGNGICINIRGHGLGTIIGRRGETLDSIQYLTGLVVNRLEGDYLRVTVDCGEYRSKRKETLEALAGKLASQVLKTNVSKILEPMNPFERRVIHAAVARIEGVTSSSIGEEPNRRVVITSPTARRPARGGGSKMIGERERRPIRGGGRDRDRSGKGVERDNRRPSRGAYSTASAAPEGPPKETPESAAIGNAPIGKLDLE